MNISLQDPFRSGDIPEGVEDYLMDSLGSKANCLKFNRRGTMLAVGNQSGTISLWDFQTKSIVRLLVTHKQCINSLTWTRDGKQLLSCSSDGSIILWDIINSTVIHKIDFESPITSAQLHPRNGNICLVSLISNIPILIDFTTLKQTIVTLPPEMIPINTIDEEQSKKEKKDMIASYNWKGNKIVVGDSKGNIVFFTTSSMTVERIIKIPSGAAIKEFEFSRNGKHMLVNSNDKVIRLYSLDTYTVIRDFHDSVNRAQWKKCCFSNNSEYLVAGMQHKSMHNIFVWSVSGGLVKDLEGPKEGFQFICWHPVRPMILTISLSGIIYIWSTIYTDSWSSFAPDFTELDENEEYQEREDEFDNKDEDDEPNSKDKMKIDNHSNEDDIIDIDTVEKIPEFSSDEEEDIFIFRTIPDP